MNSGDLVFCSTKGIIGKGIRWAQRREQNDRYSRWNHVAILDRRDNVTGEWFIIQAEPTGVTNDKLLSSINGDYEIIPLPVILNPDKFLEFVRAQVGHKYGYLSIFSCALDMFLPDSICLRKDGTWICSGLVAGALWYCGFKKVTTWSDMYTETPAGLARLVTS